MLISFEMCTPLEYTEIPKVPFMPRHKRRHLKRSRENNKSNNGNIDNNGIKCHLVIMRIMGIVITM